MYRCLQLARQGAGTTAPNPMVGAVLVHGQRIIGEGFTQPYGQAHAEVMCIGSVTEADKALLPFSTLYVSLEPCAHFGKTPPCADLIIQSDIPAVVIGCTDPFAAVNGKGIERLRQAGIAVTEPVLEAACKALNKRFFTFHTLGRPYIFLKWAQSADGFIAGPAGRTTISHAATNRLVHRRRSEEAAILVGTQTALTDNPQLTVRHWPGPQPLRLVVDRHNRLPASLHLLDGHHPTTVFTYQEKVQQGQTTYCRITPGTDELTQLLQHLHRMNVNSVLVEGGAILLQQFIQQQLWDEAMVITNEDLHLVQGTAAPMLAHHQLQRQDTLFSDRIAYYKNQRTN